MHPRRYTAFISYRHADNTQEGRRWAEWLHRALERYTVPPDLIGTPNLRGEPVRDSLYPIFRDEDELPANADLATGIRAALEVSDHLIVLCSPRSAVSPWVRKEVREFKELGRSDRILAIILAGEPNADDPAKAREGILRDEECFCEELRFGAVREDGTLDWTIRTEPLAADLRPEGTRAEGFVTPEAYREYLTLNSSLTPEKITSRVEAYRQQLDHGILKVAAGVLGVPLGQLVDRDAAHRAALARKELERVEMEAARLRGLNRRLMIAGAGVLMLATAATWFWWSAGVERAHAERARHAAEGARDAAEDVISEAVVGMRDKLMPVGKVQLLADMVSAAQIYLDKLPAELRSSSTEAHRASLLLNQGLVAAALGKDSEQEKAVNSALALVDGLEASGQAGETLQKEASLAGLNICYLYYYRADVPQALNACQRLRDRCGRWLQTHPDSAWALRYSAMSSCISGLALARIERKGLEAAPHLLAAKVMSERLIKAVGQTADSFELRGMIHYGEAYAAQRIYGQQTKVLVEFEAAMNDYAKALEMGGTSALLRELHAGSMHNAGSQYLGLYNRTKNSADLKQGQELQRRAFEERKRLVALDPDHLSWWRDLGHSYAAMAKKEQGDGDWTSALAMLNEALVCREHAISKGTNRPQLFYELTMTLEQIAQLKSSMPNPDFRGAFDDLYRALEVWLDTFSKAHTYTDGTNLTGRVSTLLVVKENAHKAKQTELAAAELTRWKDRVEVWLKDKPDESEVTAALLQLTKARTTYFSLIGKSTEARLADNEAQTMKAKALSNASPAVTLAWCVQTHRILEQGYNEVNSLQNSQKRTAECQRLIVTADELVGMIEPLAARQEATAEALTLAAKAQLDRSNFLRVLSRNEVPKCFEAARKHLDKAAEKAKGQATGEAEVREVAIKLEHDWGMWLNYQELYQDARGHFAAAIRLRNESFKDVNSPAAHHGLASSSVGMGVACRALMQWTEAEKAFAEAIVHFTEATRLDPAFQSARPPKLDALIERLNAQRHIDPKSVGAAQIDAVIAQQDALLNGEVSYEYLNRADQSWARLTGDLGRDGDNASALKIYEAQFVIRTRIVAGSPNNLNAKWSLGRCLQGQATELYSLKLLDQAEKKFHESIKVRAGLEVPPGAGSGDGYVKGVIESWRKLALISEDRKNWEQAEECARQGIAAFDRMPKDILAKPSLDLQAYTLIGEQILGRAQRRGRKLDTAEALLKSVIERTTVLVNADKNFSNTSVHSAHVISLWELTQTYLDAKKMDQGQETASKTAAHIAAWKKAAGKIADPAQAISDKVAKVIPGK